MSAVTELVKDIIEKVNSGRLDELTFESYTDNKWKDIILFLNSGNSQQVQMIKIVLVIHLMRRITEIKRCIEIMDTNLNNPKIIKNETVNFQLIFKYVREIRIIPKMYTLARKYPSFQSGYLDTLNDDVQEEKEQKIETLMELKEVFCNLKMMDMVKIQLFMKDNRLVKIGNGDEMYSCKLMDYDETDEKTKQDLLTSLRTEKFIQQMHTQPVIKVVKEKDEHEKKLRMKFEEDVKLLEDEKMMLLETNSKLNVEIDTWKKEVDRMTKRIQELEMENERMRKEMEEMKRKQNEEMTEMTNKCELLKVQINGKVTEINEIITSFILTQQTDFSISSPESLNPRKREKLSAENLFAYSRKKRASLKALRSWLRARFIPIYLKVTA